MTKIDVIKRAYEDAGVDWDKISRKVDDNGFADMYYVNPIFTNLAGNDIESMDADDKHCRFWRPITLKGIETNNGWTRIESEKDLPMEEGTYEVHSIVDWEPYYRVDIFTGILSNAIHHITGKPIFTHYKKYNRSQPPIY